MTNTNGPQAPRPPGQADSPGDIPAERPAALSRLDALLGEWDLEAVFVAGYFGPGSPPVAGGGGRTTFEWLDGEYFLIQRFAADSPAAPDGIAIIGCGDETDTFSQHYYDSRGVARRYQMSLKDGVWKAWREAPGCWQRYTGVFSDDGRTIKGAWEGSPDGSQWKHDFELNYVKADQDPAVARDAHRRAAS
jgi:hypothetical protein